jgi:flagellar hook-associated protein 1 FlgK
MSLTSAMTIATSGMRAAQTGIRTVSDNIANVNTAGYVRKVVDQSATVISGTGAGVTVDGIRRTADMYLQKAMMNASAQVGQTGAVAEFLDRAQALFGDPSEASSFFNQLDPIFKAFATASENPTSGLRLSEATLQVKSFFDNAGQIGAELRGLVDQVGLRIGSAVDQANGLLDDINALNTEISRALISGRDASGAENVQSQLIDQLSKIVQLRISKGPTGGVTLAVADGTLLTGENRGRFEFASSGGAPGVVRLKFEFGAPVTLGDGLGGGELKGLIEMRDRVLPSISEQLGEFTARAADALNKAHNAASTAPAPTALSGRRRGRAGGVVGLVQRVGRSQRAGDPCAAGRRSRRFHWAHRGRDHGRERRRAAARGHRLHRPHLPHRRRGDHLLLDARRVPRGAGRRLVAPGGRGFRHGGGRGPLDNGVGHGAHQRGR